MSETATSGRGCWYTDLGAGAERGVDDGPGVEVALARGRRADPDGLVGGAHVQRAAVGVAVHGDGGDPEAARGAYDPARDLAPVRHQHLLDAPAAGRCRGRGPSCGGCRGRGGEEPRGEEGQRGHGAARRAPAAPAPAPAAAQVEVEEAGGHHAVAVVGLVEAWRAVVVSKAEWRGHGSGK